MLEDAGEEFRCESEATIVKRGYASFSAQANGSTSTKSLKNEQPGAADKKGREKDNMISEVWSRLVV